MEFLTDIGVALLSGLGGYVGETGLF